MTYFVIEQKASRPDAPMHLRLDGTLGWTANRADATHFARDRDVRLFLQWLLLTAEQIHPRDRFRYHSVMHGQHRIVGYTDGAEP